MTDSDLQKELLNENINFLFMILVAHFRINQLSMMRSYFLPRGGRGGRMIVVRGGSSVVFAPGLGPGGRALLTWPDLGLLIRRPLTLLCSGLGMMGTL